MINIRNREEIELIRESGRLVAGALDLASELVGPGVETGALDREIEEYIIGNGGTPEFKGYQGYPATICASINEEVVHGIPGSRVLRNGDIIGIDVGVRKNGYVADGARTFAIGGITERTERLVEVTREALNTAISIVREGVHLSDISHAIQRMAEDAGFSVVRELTGHGVGTELHEAPEIPNYGDPGLGPVLKAGMILAIEPMLNAGVSGVETLADNWTVVTADRHRSAHFEHTVAVTTRGADVLTQ
ncbi:MAG: type I methionyl aminopeptidase [Candidatus Eisenbacteria sp.]|nr:type I methionyl aminopeptidase [Candidatus Eisenbacteria bacterium]